MRENGEGAEKQVCRPDASLMLSEGEKKERRNRSIPRRKAVRESWSCQKISGSPRNGPA